MRSLTRPALTLVLSRLIGLELVAMMLQLWDFQYSEQLVEYFPKILNKFGEITPSHFNKSKLLSVSMLQATAWLLNIRSGQLWDIARYEFIENSSVPISLHSPTFN